MAHKQQHRGMWFHPRPDKKMSLWQKNKNKKISKFLKSEYPIKCQTLISNYQWFLNLHGFISKRCVISFSVVGISLSAIYNFFILKKSKFDKMNFTWICGSNSHKCLSHKPTIHASWIWPNHGTRLDPLESSTLP